MRFAERNKGFSLVELVIASGLAGVVLLIAGTVLQSSNSTIKRQTQELDASITLTRLTHDISRYFSTAIDVHWVGAANPDQLDTADLNYQADSTPVAIGETRGRLKAYDSIGALFPNVANTHTRVDAFAMFLRESRRSAAITVGDLQGVAMYYQHPRYVSDADNQSGAVYIVRTADGAGNNQTMQPIRRGSFYNGLVEFEVRNPRLSPDANFNTAVLGFEIRAVTRHYIGTGVGRSNFCPQAYIDSGDCNRPTIPYRDLEKVIHITVQNNIVGSDPLTTVNINNRVYGPIYFFEMRPGASFF